MFKDLPVEQNIPLAPFTTFKIGGPAAYFLRAKTSADIESAYQQARSHNIPVFILGGGSNILVHDHGFNGLVIKIELTHIDIQGTVVTAGAGTLLNAVIMRSVRAGLSGLEFATGVPASVGGAVWANLGCRGSEIGSVVHSVQVLEPDTGQTKTLSQADCQFAYRDSLFKHQSWVILQASFQLTTGDAVALRAKMVELTKLKKDEQNVGEDTAGCAFRNPHNHLSTAAQSTTIQPTAAQLIDTLGLKGYAIGGAQVSDKHANFIINAGGATADDVVQLISYVKQQVRDSQGVQLMEEVEYVGFE